MRTRLLLIPLLLASAAASAQVSVDPKALDALQPPATQATPKPAPAKPAPAPVRKPQPAPVQPAAPPPPLPKPSMGTTIRPTPGVAGTPTVPAAPPPGIVVPPPIAVPTRPSQPPTPPTISADSPSTTSPLQGGLRVAFGTGRADINPAVDGAIRALTRGTGPVSPEATSYTITTYAAGTAEDPSTARRLSLARALTVRSVLISQGVASVRIYVKAYGPASPGFADGPADRADIVLGLNPVPPPATAPAAAKTASPSTPPPAAKPR